jgi:hypothetical protein
LLRQTLESTTIRSVGYQAAYQTLEIEMSDGHVFQYFIVPVSAYLALMNAASHERYFSDYIKGHYPFRKKQ